jgi:hypothetical protein
LGAAETTQATREMYRTLEGGTDAAEMVVFDPAALPDDFDARQKDDPIAQLEVLQKAGCLYRIETHADGGYELGVHIGNGLSDELQPFVKTRETITPFHIPGGRLFFTGVEYAFQTDDSFLRKYPHMGEAVELESGEYRAEFFDFEYPEDFHEELLQKRLPPAQFHLLRSMNTLAPIGCISVLALLGSLALLKWTVWLSTALPVGGLLIALPVILSRLPAYRRANGVYRAIQKEYPGYGVLLQKAGPGDQGRRVTASSAAHHAGLRPDCQ